MEPAIIIYMIHNYLVRLGKGEVTIPQEFVDEYTINVGKRVNKERKEKFTLRMSNIGRPLCQLQLERDNTPKTVRDEYQKQFTFMVGDVSELWLIMIMKAAGVPVEDYDIPLELSIGGTIIKGTADIIIGGGLYDIKTMSSKSFKKYTDMGGFLDVLENDPFGYVLQGFNYGEALGIPFKGWIVINKNTGDIEICEVPLNAKKYHDDAIKKANNVVETIITNQPFKRQFTDEEELYRKKPTGNRILGKTCEWCSYNGSCWPDAEYKPSIVSASKTPPWRYYTEIADDNN
jgi:hypothetical protein